MARRLERVTTACWGDSRRGILHVDVDELTEHRADVGQARVERRRLALAALRVLHDAALPCIVVAHVAGMARFGVQR